jgi:hypothetical protein
LVIIINMKVLPTLNTMHPGEVVLLLAIFTFAMVSHSEMML